MRLPFFLPRDLPPDFRDTWLSNELFELFNCTLLRHVGPTRRPNDPNIIDLYVLRLGEEKEDVVCAYDTRSKQFFIGEHQQQQWKFHHWSDALDQLWRMADATRELVCD